MSKFKMIVVGLVTVFVIIPILFGSWGIVKAGNVGVKTRFGAVVSTLNQGLYFKIPYIESVVTMDVQTQKEQVNSVEAASQDLQTVDTNVAVNYHLEPNRAATMFSQVGTDYASRIIDPAIQETVKSNTAKYTAEELITQREIVRSGIVDLLVEKMKQFGITVDALNITNFDFSGQFNAAIETKVTAEQNALAAKNKLDQVKYEAEQRVTQAKGEAEAIAIQATAIQSAGGSDYVKLQWIKQWNGVLPTTELGGNSTPLINLGK